MLFSRLSTLSQGMLKQLPADQEIEHVITDSRKATPLQGSCFFAFRGPRHNGHQYIRELYQTGIRQFVVEEELELSRFPDANFFQATSALSTLQTLASVHRAQFTYPVIGITGSNGKTIIKEWLFQLLSPDFHVVKNPASYNSQLGVPLSVLQMRSYHQLGIFEAGISTRGEMGRLARIIQPTIGIFTNIGSAHDEGFDDRQEKIEEKLMLFEEEQLIIYCADHSEVHAAVVRRFKNRIGWGRTSEAEMVVTFVGKELHLIYHGTSHAFYLPFVDEASVENLTHCIALLVHWGIAQETIQERITQLRAVPMRLEMKQGINQCQIIDDSYNNDLAGLQMSINFLSAQQKRSKTLILSDLLQSGLPESELFQHIASIVRHAGLQRLIGIGPAFCRNSNVFSFLPASEFFISTDQFLDQYPVDRLQSEAVLIKGARVFEFERLVQRLQKKIHGTVMEIDLNAMVQNLNFFKSKLNPAVKLMVMVKAFAYGSGSEEVANLMQFHKVDYLGVAYADEGVELRKNHIALPIMVMNPTEESFPNILTYHLEPEVYSLPILKSLTQFLDGRPLKVHLKIDSGMHRLGIEPEDVQEALTILKANGNMVVATVFTHLAGSDESMHDSFTRQQVEVYEREYERIALTLNTRPLRHVLNSPGILRFPQFQFDMVRLGIGLYGINPTEGQVVGLKPVATLKTVVSQVKRVKKGQTIGYGRKGVAEADSTLATIAIGYADGFSRSFSRGVGHVLVNGKKAPVIGNVCMDMTMIDVTGYEVHEGDEVIVFGGGLPIEEVAGRIGTIPYEILTSTSERVKRVYFAESI